MAVTQRDYIRHFRDMQQGKNHLDQNGVWTVRHNNGDDGTGGATNPQATFHGDEAKVSRKKSMGHRCLRTPLQRDGCDTGTEDNGRKSHPVPVENGALETGIRDATGRESQRIA